MRSTRDRALRAVRARAPRASVALCLALLGLLAPAAAQLTGDECAECHGDAAMRGGVVTDSLRTSAHEGMGCLDCHAGIAELPHPEALPPADCGSCHGDQVAAYTKHGRAVVEWLHGGDGTRRRPCDPSSTSCTPTPRSRAAPVSHSAPC